MVAAGRSAEVEVLAPPDADSEDDGRVEVPMVRGWARVFSLSSRSAEVEVLAPPDADSEDNGFRDGAVDALVDEPVAPVVSAASDCAGPPGLAGPLDPVDDSEDEAPPSESGAALATP